MATVPKAGSGLIGKLAGALMLLLLAAWVARQVYEWLAPLVPSVLVMLGLVMLLATLARVWRK